MNQKSLFYLCLMFILLALAACNVAGDSVSVADAASQDGAVSVPAESEGGEDKISVTNCAEAEPGTHQLIYAAEGICFLYPDNYDVSQGADGSLTLYVRSLLNTEAPLATIHFAALNGRAIQEVVPDYPSDADLATMSLLTIDLGEEMATVLDNLPGQDTNRRVIAVHNDKVYDLMIARIGEEYGSVGKEAEALYNLITSSFQFIGIEPEAPLLAGPECPELVEAATLYTSEVAGYCLLLPADYQVSEINPEAAENEMAFYVDTIQDASHARLWIKTTDAKGRSLEEITNEHEAEIEKALPGFDVMWSFGYMLDGIAANQFDQVPGQDLSRQVLMVHNDRLYSLTFTPDDPSSAAYDEMQSLYDMVMDSFSFLR